MTFDDLLIIVSLAVMAGGGVVFVAGVLFKALF